MSIENVLPLIDQLYPRSIITLDIPGVGESSCLATRYSLSDMAVIIKQVLDVLDHKQVDVLGISWGRVLAQQFAYEIPGRCGHLILAATSPGIVMIPGLLSLILKKPLFAGADVPNADESNALPFNALKDQLDFAKRIIVGLNRTKRQGIVFQMLAVLGWTSFSWLPKLDQPTLILMGSRDRIAPAINENIFLARKQNIAVKVLPGDHFFLLSNSVCSAEVINDFINENF